MEKLFIPPSSLGLFEHLNGWFAKLWFALMSQVSRKLHVLTFHLHITLLQGTDRIKKPIMYVEKYKAEYSRMGI